MLYLFSSTIQELGRCNIPEQQGIAAWALQSQTHEAGRPHGTAPQSYDKTQIPVPLTIGYGARDCVGVITVSVRVCG